MIYGGYQGGPYPPYGAGPYSGGVPPTAGPGFGPPIVGGGFGPPHGRRPGETNPLATLSIVFAFVFAPAGAVLGHVALSQIKRYAQRGRDRALIGLTLSYVAILVAIVALVVWGVTAQDGASTTVPTPITTTPTTPSPAPSVRTTVITPPPAARPTVLVKDLRVGDCVEIQQYAPDTTANDPSANWIFIYRTPCEVRDGVFRVDQISAPNNACNGEYLNNPEKTIFACVTKFSG